MHDGLRNISRMYFRLVLVGKSVCGVKVCHLRNAMKLAEPRAPKTGNGCRAVVQTQSTMGAVEDDTGGDMH
jgi:hypothetical protein